MFQRRNNNGGLPMATHSSGYPDGSGRAVKMDAPVIRAWKNASTFTKSTYYWFVGSLLLIFFSWRHISYHHASIHFDCHSSHCTIRITPLGRTKTIKLDVARGQVVGTDVLKVNPQGRILETSVDTKPEYRNKKKRKGPDADGNYDSYRVTLINKKPEEGEPNVENTENIIHIDNKHDKNPREEQINKKFEWGDLSKLDEWMEVDHETGNHVLIMRQFNLGQTGRRSRVQVTKLQSYIKTRRHKVTIRENTSTAWKGIFGIIIGVLSLLFCVLLGSFYETSSNRNRQGGPGSRQGGTQQRAYNPNPSTQKRHY